MKHMVNFYKKIPIWENVRRINLLIDFRNKVIQYFQNIQYHNFGTIVEESPKALKLRSEINNILQEVIQIVHEVGVLTTITCYPPPAVGGFVTNIDFLDNLFYLHQAKVEPQVVIDKIDRTIGVYEKDKFKALVRTINPLYWIGIFLQYIVNIPFELLGLAGFDKSKIETSTVGKIIKSILYLITVFAALLTILEKLGYLDWFKSSIFKK